MPKTTPATANRVALPCVFHLGLLVLGASLSQAACGSDGLRKPGSDAAAGSGGGAAASGGAPGNGGSSAARGGTGGGNGGSVAGEGGSPLAGVGGIFARAGGSSGATSAMPATGGAVAAGGAAATGGRAGSTGSAAGGSGGRQPDAGADANLQPDTPADVTDDLAPGRDGRDGGTVLDGGWGEVGSVLADFCVGSQSKVFYRGQSYPAPATSKWTDPFLDCCMVYAARLHTSEALETDFEVVLRMQVGKETTGVLPVGGVTGNRVWVSLRTTPTSKDGGVAADPTMTGSVSIDGQVFGANAWTLGVCVSVDDPASPLVGTRVYVPGVPVAPSNWASRLRFLPLADAALVSSSLESKDLQTLELGTQPLLDLTDIDFVDLDTKPCGSLGEPSCNWVGLNAVFLSGRTLAGKVSNTAPGMPFVVEADGERIYMGVFWSIISAYAPSVARVGFEDIREDGFPIYPPRASSALPDLRSDPRIVKVLTEAGKCIP